MLNRAVVTLLPLVPRPIVWRISRRYIAGTSLDDAIACVHSLNAAGMTATLDVLGEDTTNPEQAIAGRDLYLRTLDAIEDQGLACNISVKLSQMGLRFDPELCRSVMRELVSVATERRNFVRIDMEDSSVTQVTLDIYRELRRASPAVGVVVQSRLRRTPDDLAKLLAEGPTNIRICKGIYVEPPEIAIQERQGVRDAFLANLRQLIEGGATRVGIATHDPPLVEGARAILSDLDVSKERYEFQMLLGVAETLRGQLVKDGHPLRVYVPFGEEWYAYSSRRLRENPQIAGHVVRNLFRSRPDAPGRT